MARHGVLKHALQSGRGGSRWTTLPFASSWTRSASAPTLPLSSARRCSYRPRARCSRAARPGRGTPTRRSWCGLTPERGATSPAGAPSAVTVSTGSSAATACRSLRPSARSPIRPTSTSPVAATRPLPQSSSESRSVVALRRCSPPPRPTTTASCPRRSARSGTASATASPTRPSASYSSAGPTGTSTST